MPTTEIVSCALKPGSQIGDPSNPAAAVLKSVGDTLVQQDGNQGVQFGMQIENPDSVQLMINWESLNKHKEFMASSTYGPFFQSFASIVASQPQIVHADFQPNDAALSKALSAPVTEIATFFFEGDEPADYIPGALKFREICEKESGVGYVDSAVGITHESDLEKGGKAAVVVIGWQSVEDHMKFREHEVFKANIDKLRNGSAGAEIHHVQFMNFVKE